MTARTRRTHRARFTKPRVVFHGKLFTVEQWKAIYPSGTVKLFERVKRNPSVGILALDARGRLLLIREYRETHGRWRWSIPGGRVENGQSPREAAQRELREEAGYRARSLRLFMRGGAMATVAVERYLFLAHDLIRDPLPHDEGEEITVIPVPLEKAYRMCVDGTINLEFVALGIMRLYHQETRKRRPWQRKK